MVMNKRVTIKDSVQTLLIIKKKKKKVMFLTFFKFRLGKLLPKSRSLVPGKSCDNNKWLKIVVNITRVR